MNSDEEDQPESVQDPHLKAEIHRLKKDLLSTRHELARAKKESTLKDKALQNKSEEVTSLSGKVQVYVSLRSKHAASTILSFHIKFA